MTPQRKPLAREMKANARRRLPLPVVRKQIWTVAQSLAEGAPIVATLARRFGLATSVIEAVLVAEGIRHERTAVALRTGIVNALEIAREASNENEAAA